MWLSAPRPAPPRCSRGRFKGKEEEVYRKKEKEEVNKKDEEEFYGKEEGEEEVYMKEEEEEVYRKEEEVYRKSKRCEGCKKLIRNKRRGGGKGGE